MAPVDLLWAVCIGTGVILLIAGFFLMMIISNQKRVVSAQKEKLEKSRHLEEVLREIPAKIILGQEEERRRVAKELHDGINQMLASIKYRIHALKLDRVPEPGTMRARMDEISTDLTLTMEEIRRLSHRLRPKVLDDLGFDAALRSLGEEFQERTRIITHIEIGGEPGLQSPEAELGVYRIAQEALQNIEKHAGATMVTIRCAGDASAWSMTIQDDGKGFAQERSGAERDPRAGGIGLSTMAERANLMGGSLTINSSPNHGTVVGLTFTKSR
ncbi:MAG TPA: histidine kinase [Bacteroidota bacterium]|nr:histidine kinase [Bacteroidota bacterium]